MFRITGIQFVKIVIMIETIRGAGVCSTRQHNLMFDLSLVSLFLDRVCVCEIIYCRCVGVRGVRVV